MTDAERVAALRLALTALRDSRAVRRRVVADKGLDAAGKRLGIECAGVCGALDVCIDELTDLLTGDVP